MPQSSTNPVFVYDDAGRVADANEAAAVLADIPLPKLRRMHLRDFFHPDELPITEERMRSLVPVRSNASNDGSDVVVAGTSA